jgi:hypothetical protein
MRIDASVQYRSDKKSGPDPSGRGGGLRRALARLATRSRVVFFISLACFIVR